MTLAEILRENKPVLIDFFSSNCPPCFVLADTLQSLKNKMKGDCVIFTVDREKHPEVFAAFGIKKLPHLKLFINGRPAWEGSGLFREDELILQLKKHMNHGKIQ